MSGALSAQELVLAALPRMAPEIAWHASVQVGMWIPCYIFARWGWPGHKDLICLADTFASLLLFPVLCACALFATTQLYSTVDLRWSATTATGTAFFNGFFVRMLLHTPMQFFVKMPKQQLVLMTFHHIVSFTCCFQALVTQRMQFFGCFSGCCEVSTVFLTNLWFFKDVTYQGKELKEHLPTAYTVNGVLLWLSFLVFRLLLFPIWFHLWYRDIRDFPAKTWDASTQFEQYVHPSVVFLLLGLSTFWFVPLTKGFLKAVRTLGGGKGAQQKQE